MEMRNLILQGHNILSIEVKIDEKEYIFGVQWKAPKKSYDDTWVLKSYANKLNGAKDLSVGKNSRIFGYHKCKMELECR